MLYREDDYMCGNCTSTEGFHPETGEMIYYIYKNESNNPIKYKSGEHEPHMCPNCITKMKYCGTDIIDSETGKCVNGFFDEKLGEKPKQQIHKNATVTSVECPYCHGKNTKKISTTSKVVNTALFGWFGNKRTKQWHCNNCNSDF